MALLVFTSGNTGKGKGVMLSQKAVAYKRIKLIRVRKEEFPKNTLRKIMRFKIDMTID